MMFDAEIDLREVLKSVVFAEIGHLCAEYGTVRVAKVEPHGGVNLVLFSPPMMIAGDIPITPFTVCDGALYDRMKEAFGSVRAAADFFSANASLHFEER